MKTFSGFLPSDDVEATQLDEFPTESRWREAEKDQVGTSFNQRLGRQNRSEVAVREVKGRMRESTAQGGACEETDEEARAAAAIALRELVTRPFQ